MMGLEGAHDSSSSAHVFEQVLDALLVPSARPPPPLPPAPLSLYNTLYVFVSRESPRDMSCAEAGPWRPLSCLSASRRLMQVNGLGSRLCDARWRKPLQ